METTKTQKAEITKKLIERAKQLLDIPEVYKMYQSKETEEDAKEWLLSQALITLMYSHKERMQMLKKKQAQN